MSGRRIACRMTSSRCGSTSCAPPWTATAGRPFSFTAMCANTRRSLFSRSFIPRVRWGMALLPRTGDARLLCAMSTRDLPAMRTLTWIADVRSGMGPEWEKAFDPWVERFKGDQAQKLGTHRLRHHGAGAARRGAPQPRRSVRVATRRRCCRHSVAPQAAARADDDAGVVQIARNRGKNFCRELARQPRAGNRGARCRTRRAFARRAGCAHAGQSRRRPHAGAVPGPVRKMRRAAGRLSRRQGFGLLGRYVRHRR